MKYWSLLLFLLLAIHTSAQVQKTTVDSKKPTKIIVYGSDTCHFCIDTKAYLKAHDVAFVYYDVDVNLPKQNEMILKLTKAKIDVSQLSLPVIDKDGEVFTNSTDFEKFLEKIIQ